MVKNVYREQVCFNGIYVSKKSSETDNIKVAGKMKDCIFLLLKISFIINLCGKNRL
jgi:hypothetical protein